MQDILVQLRRNGQRLDFETNFRESSTMQNRKPSPSTLLRPFQLQRNLLVAFRLVVPGSPNVVDAELAGHVECPPNTQSRSQGFEVGPF
jgi:hypothetical protein